MNYILKMLFQISENKYCLDMINTKHESNFKLWKKYSARFWIPLNNEGAIFLIESCTGKTIRKLVNKRKYPMLSMGTLQQLVKIWTIISSEILISKCLWNTIGYTSLPWANCHTRCNQVNCTWRYSTQNYQNCNHWPKHTCTN